MNHYPAMKILVCGASGFIGKSICERLAAAGHDVVRGVRQPSAPGDMAIDFSRDTDIDSWAPRLAGIDVAINAVGIITETSASRFGDVHRNAPCALFAACLLAGVKRVIQISALGAETGDTRYFKTKFGADQCLMKLPIEWQILRPSLVYGDDGISASMFRMLASLPVIPIPDAGAASFQPVHIDDLTEAVTIAIAQQTPVGQCIELVGATKVSYRVMLEAYRRAMGFPAGLCVTIPAPIMAVAARASAMIPGAPLNPENWRMLQAGSAGDASALTRLLGRAPRGIDEFIPADRSELLRYRALAAWRAPMLRIALAVVWFAAAYVSTFAYPVADSLDLLARVGLVGAPATIALYGASALDFLMGVACLKYPSRALWLAQAALVLGYTAIISYFIPEFLTHPFGPVVKNIPILGILVFLFAEEK